MKTKLTLLLCILFLASAVKAQTSPLPPDQLPPGLPSLAVRWPRYTVKGEEFSIALPTIPSMVTRKIPRAGTDKQRMERVLQASAGSVEYSIYIYENPKPRQSLEDFIREQTANSSREVTRERILSINGRGGKEYRYQVNDKPATEQFFAAEKRLYRFVASGAPADHAGVQQFFSSLEFGNKPLGFEVQEGPGEALIGGGNETVYKGSEVDTKVRLLAKPDPSYTEAARQAQITGTVVLNMVFSSTGTINNIRVVQGLPRGLTEVSIAAARKIKFVPATKEGKPVSVWMQVVYTFELF